MKLQIEIPKEFEEDFESDRFKDFFKRVIADIDITGLHGNLCGNYEKETAHMFVNAFENAKEVYDGWHNVLDGDYPKADGEVIVTQKFGDGHTNVTYAVYTSDVFGEKNHWSSGGYRIRNVIAWKPLPEPYKSTT